MERPNSRGLASGGVARPPSAGPKQTPARPQTPTRAGGLAPPGTSYGQPPPTASRNIGTPFGPPPGTAQRGGVTRPGTGALDGGGRQVRDATFYANLLRKKRQEIVEAITKMQVELEEYDKGFGKYEQMERRATDLFKEVQTLQGQFQDYNMVLDHNQSMQDPAKLQEQLQSLEAKNVTERAQVEDIFDQRSESDARLKQLEDNIAKMTNKMEDLLQHLPADGQRDYHQMNLESQKLQEDKKRLNLQKSQLEQAVNEVEQEVSTQPNRKKLLQIQKEVGNCNKEVQQLEIELRPQGESLDDEFQKITGQIKSINANVQEKESLVKSLKQDLRDLERGISVPQPTISDTSANSAEFSRYDSLELDENQRSMVRFINEYEESKSQKIDQMSELQSKVVAATESLSNNQENIQGGGVMGGGKELNKLAELSQKISSEMNEIEQKLEECKSEIERLSDLEALRGQHHQQKSELEQQHQQLQTQFDKLKGELGVNSQKLQDINENFKKNPQYSQIEKLDDKIKKVVKNNSQIQSFIKTKMEQTDYETTIDELETMTDDVNQQLMNSVLAF